MALKKRLDVLLLEKGLVQSRQRARALIMAGKVLVDTQRVDKPGAMVYETAAIIFKGEDLPYVSRGGLKLEAALQAFALSVEGLVCMDVGASTGGFTDCLLQHGASHVFAVDVGYGQLDWSLRRNPRVTPIERTNFRFMDIDRIGQPVDLITIDVSFISLKQVIPQALKFLKPRGSILALIKPQFEVGRGKVGKGGVVRDSALHEEVIASLKAFGEQMGLMVGPSIASPILGPKGNQEFIFLLKN